MSSTSNDTSTALKIATPQLLEQCDTVTLRWTGGTPPYALEVGTYHAVLANFVGITTTSMVWTANVTAGTTIALLLNDTAGANAASDLFIVGDSANNTCLHEPDTDQHHTSLGKGAIAGIIVAGIVLCVAVPAAVSFSVRRRRRRWQHRRLRVDLNESSLTPEAPGISSKTREAYVQQVSSSIAADIDSTSIASDGPHSDGDRQERHDTHPRAVTRELVPRSLLDSHGGKLGVLHQVEDTQAPTHAEDGGIRLAGGPANIEAEEPSGTLPPPYRLY
ncbi:hypothetical protein C8Q79DRAFT_1006046 [Trametes meyenii]|nr:hypothetical protein C8Q79DRAFT_1006046 [Trametes meyenii]